MRRSPAASSPQDTAIPGSSTISDDARSDAPAWTGRVQAVVSVARAHAATAWSSLAGVVPQARPRQLAGLEEHHDGHVELPLFTRYAMVGMFLVVCLLMSAWSRIDLRQTSLALSGAETELIRARADNARLRLELASLQSPAALHSAAQTLELQGDVPVVHVPTTR